MWIFGYGSLVWRPDFPFLEQRWGWMEGFSAKFWQGSPDHRGVPGAPGRVLTAVPEAGQKLWGRLYRVGDEAVLEALDRREQGGYSRRTIMVHSGEGPVEATTWIAEPGNPHWLGQAPVSDLVRQVRSSFGPSGSNREYVLALGEALGERGGDHLGEVVRELERQEREHSHGATVDLARQRAWILDLDGTLTHAVHDFDGFKREHGMPLDRPVLEALDAYPAPERRRIEQALTAWEQDHVDEARPAPGVRTFLETLRDRGCRLGILTRNTHQVALGTLQATELGEFFLSEDVIGRDEAHPKPAPHGIHRLLDAWGVSPAQAVMVGDFVMDVAAGFRAGTATVFVEDPARPHPGAADARRLANRVVPHVGALV